MIIGDDSLKDSDTTLDEDWVADDVLMMDAGLLIVAEDIDEILGIEPAPVDGDVVDTVLLDVGTTDENDGVREDDSTIVLVMSLVSGWIICESEVTLEAVVTSVGLEEVSAGMVVGEPNVLWPLSLRLLVEASLVGDVSIDDSVIRWVLNGNVEIPKELLGLVFPLDPEVRTSHGDIDTAVAEVLGKFGKVEVDRV